VLGVSCGSLGRFVVSGKTVSEDEGEDGEELLEDGGGVAFAAPDLVPKPKQTSVTQASHGLW
jgi:hypothetical protein